MATAQNPLLTSGHDVDWRDIAAKVGDLPPMPHVAAKAISLVENPEATANGLSEVMAKDTALAARVLKIANSAMFSRQRKITTLNQAVMTIGFKGLKGIIIAAALRQMNKSLSPTEKLIWERSIATAICATKMARHLKRRYVDEIFLAGLLHSLGQVVLLSKRDTAERYREVTARIEREGLNFVLAEEQVFGFSHPLLGALVAKKWNFSPETCQVILHYRDQLESPTNETEEQALIVRLAEIVGQLCGIGTLPGYPNEEPLALTIVATLGVLPADVPRLLASLVEETRAQFEQERHIYD